MKFIFYDNQISYIDISILKELYYNDSLKGASILHKLFNFNDLQDMDYTMRKENDTYMLFHDLNITFDSWISLFNFIMNSIHIDSGTMFCKYNWILGSMHNIYNCGYSYTINANNSNNLDMYYMRKLIIDD